MNRLKKYLLNLALGELAASIVFIFLYRSLDPGKASFIAFSYLIFILLQGSAYWFYRFVLVANKRKVGPKVITLLKAARIVNTLLLIITALTLPLVRNSLNDLIIALGIFLFGLIEYINYYWYRLSYGKSGFNLKTLFNTKLEKSSINKLITKQ